MTRKKLQEDKREQAEQQVNEAWLALDSATNRLSRIHAEVPRAQEDIDILLEDLKHCRETIDTFIQASETLVLCCSNLANGPPSTSDPAPVCLHLLQQRCDRLDREGVMLFNRSTTLKHLMSRAVLSAEDASGMKTAQLATDSFVPAGNFIALLRLTAVRFIHAGRPLEAADAEEQQSSPSLSQKKYCQKLTYPAEDATRLLSLYTKVMRDFIDCGEFEAAQKTSETAAQLLRVSRAALYLRQEVVAENKSVLAARRIVLAYHLTLSRLLYLIDRFEASQSCYLKATDLAKSAPPRWEFTEPVVEHLYKLASHELQWMHQDEVIQGKRKATKFTKQEPSVTKRDRPGIKQVHTWLRHALMLLEDENLITTVRPDEVLWERKVDWEIKILRALVQAYLSRGDSDMTKAEETIDKLILLRPSFQVGKHKLRLLIRRRASDEDVKEALQACLKTMQSNQADVTAIIKEVYQIRNADPSKIRDMLTEIVRELQSQGLEKGLPWVYLPTIAFTLGLTDSEEDAEAYERLLSLITSNGEDLLTFTPEATFACQSHLWKLGDHQSKQGNFILASRWYTFTTHPIYFSLHSTNRPRAIRKSALCLLRANCVEEARNTINLTTGPSASDYYIRFLCAVIEESEAEAMAILRDFIAAQDFHLDMLLWAAKQAQQYHLQAVFRTCIESLIELSLQGQGAVSKSCFVLLRVLLKDSLNELEECPHMKIEGHIRSINVQLGAALTMLDSLRSSAKGSEASATVNFVTDVVWLYRLALDVVVVSFKVGPQALHTLLTHTHRIAEAYLELCNGTSERPDLQQVRLNAAILGLAVALLNPEHDSQDTAINAIDDFLNALSLYSAYERMPSHLQALALSHRFELLVYMRQWDQASDHLAQCSKWPIHLPLSLFQRFAQVACSDDHVPMDLTIKALETVMKHVSMTEEVDIPQLARFLRAIVATSLDRANYASAKEHVQSAIKLLDMSGDQFPRIELEWLCTTAWNTGMALQTSNAQEHKEWCQMALRLGSHLSGYGNTLDLMKQDYNNHSLLVARHE